MEGIDSAMMTKKRFQTMVEETVLKHSLSYLDAIIYICEENNMEIEDVSKYITPIIKDKIEVDALKLNYIEGGMNYMPLE
jgi:hypothetical protein